MSDTLNITWTTTFKSSKKKKEKKGKYYFEKWYTWWNWLKITNVGFDKIFTDY